MPGRLVVGDALRLSKVDFCWALAMAAVDLAELIYQIDKALKNNTVRLCIAEGQFVVLKAPAQVGGLCRSKAACE